MTARQMYLLAADHRRSFEKLFGLTTVGARDRRQLIAAKVIVVEALAHAREQRPDLDSVGVLLDDEYGAEALAAAGRLGVQVALAFERSGQAVLDFEHADWRERIARLDATSPPCIVKVLVRHRADDHSAGHDVQLARLVEVSEECAGRSAPFLLELLTPFTTAEQADTGVDALESQVRPRLVLDAIAELQARGVRPDLWKVEGIGDAARCAEVVAAVRAGGDDDVGVVVLGAGAPTETVNRWLRAAAAGGYSGFAVGRSIWAEPLAEHAAGAITADDARRWIAASYCTFVDTFAAASTVR